MAIIQEPIYTLYYSDSHDVEHSIAVYFHELLEHFVRSIDAIPGCRVTRITNHTA